MMLRLITSSFKSCVPCLTLGNSSRNGRKVPVEPRLLERGNAAAGQHCLPNACTRIPPECLWPQQSMLLNLHELFVLCVKCCCSATKWRNQCDKPAVTGTAGAAIECTHLPLPVLYPTAEFDGVKQHFPYLLCRYSERHANSSQRSFVSGAAAMLSMEEAVSALSDATAAGGLGEKGVALVAVFDEEEEAREADSNAVVAAAQRRAHYDSLVEEESSVSGGGGVDEDGYDVIERRIYRTECFARNYCLYFLVGLSKKAGH